MTLQFGGRLAFGLTFTVLTSHAQIGSAMAQQIRGRVLDAVASHGISTVKVELMSSGKNLATATTDSTGRFQIHAPRAGQYQLLASRLCYALTTIDRFNVLGAETVDVEISMAVNAVPLAPLRVVTRGRTHSQYLGHVGFYEREQHGVGSFLTRYEIEKKGGSQLSDVLRTVNGVRLMRADRSGRRWDIRLRNPRCPPSVYLDGAIIRLAGPVRPTDMPLDDIAHSIDIEGIEIYHGPSETPPEFNREAACGVIVLWTRRRR